LCLEFTNLQVLATISSNVWRITVNIVPQGINTIPRGFYDATNVVVGQWIGSGNYGYAFKIIQINSATSNTLDCNVEDVDNWNLYQDPSGGLDGPAPVPGSLGHIFVINQYGVPELTVTPIIPRPAYVTQLIGRFSSTATGGTGSSGITGPTGPAGTGGGATGPLGFIKDSDNPGGSGLTYQRDLVTFYDPDGPKTIRKWLSYTDSRTGQPMFAVQLATFSPNFTSTTIPSSPVNWDVGCTGFSVSVHNPTDFLTQYISSVYSVEQTSGVVSTLSNFAAGPKSATPAGGVDWTQTFSTNGTGVTGVIRPISNTIVGGNAGANVKYNVYNGSESLYTVSNSTISITWATPTLGISSVPLSGATFLSTYLSTTYSLSVSGITTSSNYVHGVTGTQGTVSNPTGNGTLTFTTPIHKDNTGTARIVSTSTTFTRPVAVTGTSYSAILTGQSTVSASFTYPSFWLFTTGTTTPPVRTDIVTGSVFKAGVTVLGDQVHTFGTSLVNNPSASPAAFWFCVKSDITQPTVFKTGASLDLLSNVSVTTGNTVLLQPDSPPGGYSAVSYALYGITIQPGNIYISIT
jgi:hypothetical protein